MSRVTRRLTPAVHREPSDSSGRGDLAEHPSGRMKSLDKWAARGGERPQALGFPGPPLFRLISDILPFHVRGQRLKPEGAWKQRGDSVLHGSRWQGDAAGLVPRVEDGSGPGQTDRPQSCTQMSPPRAGSRKPSTCRWTRTSGSFSCGIEVESVLKLCSVASRNVANATS